VLTEHGRIVHGAGTRPAELGGAGLDYFYNMGMEQLKKEKEEIRVQDILEACWDKLEEAARTWTALFQLQLGEVPPGDWAERVRAIDEDGDMVFEVASVGRDDSEDEEEPEPASDGFNSEGD